MSFLTTTGTAGGNIFLFLILLIILIFLYMFLKEKIENFNKKREVKKEYAEIKPEM